MLHKAWNSKGEMPYCFPRSSIKFQGHTVLNITDFDPNWAFPDYRPVAAFKSPRFALFSGESIILNYFVMSLLKIYSSFITKIFLIKIYITIIYQKSTQLCKRTYKIFCHDLIKWLAIICVSFCNVHWLIPLKIVPSWAPHCTWITGWLGGTKLPQIPILKKFAFQTLLIFH